MINVSRNAEPVLVGSYPFSPYMISLIEVWELKPFLVGELFVLWTAFVVLKRESGLILDFEAILFALAGDPYMPVLLKFLFVVEARLYHAMEPFAIPDVA